MSRTLAISVVSAAIIASLAGCRCGHLTNCYLDATDSFADEVKVNLDHLYCPALDPSRVGRPDWCRSVPDCMCRLECCRCPKIIDVPEPMFRIYPQPETGIGSEGAIDEVVEEELESVLPEDAPISPDAIAPPPLPAE